MLYNIIIVILIFLLIKNCIKENFMNYEQRRKYFKCNYGNNNNAHDCHRFFNEINSIKGYIIDNPIGFVDNNKIKRPLLGWYDRYDNKYYYYVIDYNKNKKNRIIHTIKNKGKQLFDDNVIDVPNRGNMSIKIYEDVPYMSSTSIYTDTYAHPNRYYKNKYCWSYIGYVSSENNDIYKLYESNCPKYYKYKIKLDRKIELYVRNKNTSKLSRKEDLYRFNNKLETDDIVNIDKMKGDYKVFIYKYNDLY